MITLFENKSDCCGCGACSNICPKKAIHSSVDEYGFTFPVINTTLCIECGRCLRVCPLKRSDLGCTPYKAFAAIYKDPANYNSSSGGVFAAIAAAVVEEGGVVFGCAWNEKMIAEHRAISTIDELPKLQGSKYVQSDQGECYTEAKRLLDSGRIVLYSGTPCQIAGLKSFLGKEYGSLYTVDIVCHGVPSEAFHTSYVRLMEKKLNGKIVNMNYREKSNGWSMRLRIDYKRNGRICNKRYENSDMYYYHYFEHGLICRASCYQCKYASINRPGDITLGDYWGVELPHREIKTKNGVSAILVNSCKGMDILNLTKDVSLVDSRVDWIVQGNGQLREPCSCNAY